MPAPSDFVAEGLSGILARVSPPETPSLAGFMERVRGASAAVTDAEIRALRESGCTDDQILDAVIGAAAGEGLRRLRRGISVLRVGSGV